MGAEPLNDEEVRILQQVIFERLAGALVLADGRASAELAMSADVPTLLAHLGVTKPLVVARGGLARTGVAEELARRGMPVVQFSGFAPNPTAEQVQAGLEMFRANACDGILSIGGGSAIDVAKAIKACGAGSAVQEGLLHPEPIAVPHVAFPTTAGTGSESTQFATIYIGGVKHSVSHEALLPEVAILDPSSLASLPEAERASTFLNALCHAIESYWSTAATEESRAFSFQAMTLLKNNGARYLAGEGDSFDAILVAANLAGRAINITRTTAAHAMCYTLTQMYGLRHGHAAAVMLAAVWAKLLAAAKNDTALAETLEEVSLALTEKRTMESGLVAFLKLRALAELDDAWVPGEKTDLPRLVGSVNAERLRGFPLQLSEDDLYDIYERAIWQWQGVE